PLSIEAASTANAIQTVQAPHQAPAPDANAIQIVQAPHQATQVDASSNRVKIPAHASSNPEKKEEPSLPRTAGGSPEKVKIPSLNLNKKNQASTTPFKTKYAALNEITLVPLESKGKQKTKEWSSIYTLVEKSAKCLSAENLPSMPHERNNQFVSHF